MNENQIEVTLTLQVEEANTILRSLAKLPFEEVAGLIQKVKTQGEAQLAARAEQPAAETAPAEA